MSDKVIEACVPNFMASNDDSGIVSLHWRFERGGVLVVLGGDDLAHLSIKASPDEQYSMNGEDVPIDRSLRDKIIAAIRNLYPKDDWQPTHRHYKGGLYRVLFEATHTEGGEELVIYQHESGKAWARPKDEFYSQAPDGTRRFQLLTP